MSAVKKYSVKQKKGLQRRMDLSTADQNLVKQIAKMYSCASFAEAIRACVQQQSIRDRVIGTRFVLGNPEARDVSMLLGGLPDAQKRKTLLVYCEKQCVEEPSGGHTVVNTGTMKPFLVNFQPETNAALGRVLIAWKLNQFVDGIRLSIRSMAMLSGLIS